MALRSYYYDKQIRKFLVQFMRMFNNFQYMYLDNNGNPTLSQVPVIYGDPSRQSAAVIDNNSQSTLQTVPQISIAIEDLKYNQERLQDSSQVTTMQIRERHWNPATSQFTQNQGTDYSVKRRMPTPWDLTMKVDIWTSNTDQKLQLFEQIVTLFNPSFDLQSTDNYTDWGSLTWVQLIDTNWTSRSVPIGTDNPIDIMTLHFRMPIWISPPAAVYEMGIIQKIIASVYQDNGDLNPDIIESGNQLSRQYITPLQYGVVYTGGQLIVMKQGDIDLEANTLNADTKIGTPDFWHDVLNLYGSLRAGLSQIVLNQPDGLTEVVGNITYNPMDDSLLIFTPIANTLPVNDFAPINQVIDPTKVGPGEGLPAATLGQRYLLIHATGDTSAFRYPTLWGNVVANMNDIIEYNGSEWVVSFDSESDTPDVIEKVEIHYVFNTDISIQYVWDGNGWSKSVDGYYSPGNWSVYL